MIEGMIGFACVLVLVLVPALAPVLAPVLVPVLSVLQYQTKPRPRPEEPVKTPLSRAVSDVTLTFICHEVTVTTVAARGGVWSKHMGFSSFGGVAQAGVATGQWIDRASL